MPGAGVIIQDATGGRSLSLSSAGNLPVYIAASGDNLGRVSIKDAITGKDASVNSAGRLLVDTEINLSGDIIIEDIKVAELANGTAKKLRVSAANDLLISGDVFTTPKQIGQQTITSSLSVVPASNIPDATYIGDINFGESLPTGANNIGDVDVLTLPNVNIAKIYDSIDVSGDVTVSGTVSANINAGSNNIGDVDVLTLPNINIAKVYDSIDVSGDVSVNLNAGTNNIGDVDVLSLPNVNISKIYDSVDVSGDVTVDITSSIPLTIGKVTTSLGISGDTSVQLADGVTSSQKATVYVSGAVRVSGDTVSLSRPGALPAPVGTVKSYNGNWGSAQSGTALWTPAATKRIYLHGVAFSTAVAGAIRLNMGATDITPPIYLAINGNTVISGKGEIWEAPSGDAVITVSSDIAGNHSALIWGVEV